MLGLTAFWQIQPASSIAAVTVRSCLGLSMLLGIAVAVGDAVLVHNFAEIVEAEGGRGEVAEEAKKASFRHAVAAIVIAVTAGALLWI